MTLSQLGFLPLPSLLLPANASAADGAKAELRVSTLDFAPSGHALGNSLIIQPTSYRRQCPR
jgi:hypothetical protein